MANADGSIVIDTRLDNSGFQSGSKKMQSAMNGLQNSIDSFGKQAQASVNSVAPALQNAAQQAEALSNSLTESQFNKAASQMESSVERLQGKIESLRQRAEQGFSSEAQAQKWQADLQKVEQEAATLQQKMQELGSQTVKADSLAEMEAEAQKLEQKLFALYEKRDTMQDLGADTASQAWKNLELQIQKTEEALDRVERGIAAKSDPGSIESEIGGAGYTSGSGQAGFQQLSDSMNSTMSSLRELSGTTAEYTAETAEAGSSASSFGSILMGVVKAGATGAKSILSGLVSVLSTVGRTALTTASYLAKLPFKAIGSAAGVAKKAMSAFTNKSKNATLTSNGLVKSLLSVKRMLLTRVKRMFISAIFNQVKASLQNLAKYSDAFNQSMSNIKNSAKTMSGNLAVAFGNLVNAVAPALQTVINWLSQAISYLNAFFALLQGKKTVTVAKQATDDYAKSLKKASGAAKDLNSQVYGFDELTKQESNSGSGSGNNGAEYEEQDIGSLLPESIKNLFENIKKAFEAGEFEQVGRYIAEGLNMIIYSVDDWINNTLRPAGVKWAGIIARILNGIVDGLDWAALGKLFGDGINTILEIGYTFLTTFDWAAFGQKLAVGLNSLFTTIDWKLLGNFFAAKLNAIIKTGANLLANLDWDTLGNGLYTGLKTFINGIDWASLRLLVSSGINGLIKIFDKFAKGDWIDDITKNLGETVGGILDDINWSALVWDILMGVVRISGAFWGIVKSINFPGIAAKIAEGVNSFFEPGSDGATAMETAAANAGEGINGIIKAFEKLTDPNEGINFGSIRQTITSSIRTFMSKIDFAALIASTGEMIHQLALTVLGLVTEIFSPDDEGKTIGDKLAEGLNRIFLNANGEVDLTKFQELGKSFSEAVKGIFKSINDFFEQTDWDAIGESLGEALAAVDWLGIAGDIVKFLWNALLAVVKTTGGLLGAFIRRIFGLEVTEQMDTAGATWAQTLFGSYSETVGDAEKSAEQRTLQAAALLGTGVTGELVSSLTNGSSEIYNATSQCFYEMLNAIENEDGGQLYNAFAKLGVSPPQGFIDAVNEGLLDPEQLAIIRQNGAAIFSQIVDAQTGDEVKAIFAQYGLDIPQELCDKMAEAQSSVSEAGHDLLYKLQEAAKTGDVAAAKQAFADAGIEVTDSFAENIISYGLPNMIAALALMGAGVDQATIEAMDMSHLSENLEAYMQESGKDLNTIAKELGSEVGEGIGFTIPDSIATALGIGTAEVERVKGEMVDKATASNADIEAGTAAGEELGEGSAGGVEDKLTEGQEGVGEATQGVVDEVTETMSENEDDVKAESENVADAVEDPLSELPENVRPYAETLMKAVTQAIIEGNPIATEAIEAAANAIVERAAEILSSGKGEEIGKSFMDGINNGIIYNYSFIVTNAQEFASQVVDTADGYVNESNGETIGSNMIIGMINGMNAYGQMLVNTIAHICSVCVEDARRILGIASPSKVFEQIGDYTMQGMQIGLENTGEDAINTVGDIAQAMTEEAQNGNGIHVAIDAMTDGLDSAENSLMRIADIFIGIADSIAEMGGLKVPSVANGQVLPFNAFASERSNHVAEGSGQFDGLEEALYNAISRAQSTSDSGEPVVIKLEIDGREITDVVTKYQRQQARAWG